MKKIIAPTFILLSCALPFFSSCTHRPIKPLIIETDISPSQVPLRIRETIQTSYPGISPQYYLNRKAEGDFFEADLTVNKKSTWVTFNSNGDMIQLEKEIDFNQLNASVQKKICSVLNDQYFSHEILTTETIEKRNLKPVSQEIQVKIKSDESRTGYFIVYFNMNGNHLRAEEMTLEPLITIN